MSLKSLFSPNGLSVGNLYDSTNIVWANGDITAGNAVSANYFIGNGAFLTGISGGTGSYSNANVANYLPTYTGNLASLAGNVTTSANVQGAYILGNGFFLTGINGGGSSYSNANVAAYLPNYQGNISNIEFRSNSSAAAALIVYDRALTMGGANLAYATLPDDGNANTVAAEFTNHGLGNVIISSGPADWEWTFTNSGNLSAPGNIAAGNAVSANYFLGNGALLTGIVAGSDYSNANVAAYLPTYNGNATFGNVTVSQDTVILGNLRVQGNTTYLNVTDLNIEDKNIIVAANATATMTDLNGAGLQIGNRTAGGNITFFYNSSSNIMQLSHGLSVANGITTPGTILGRTVQALGDITAIGSNIVAGQYVIGDGSQLTGILYSSLVGAYGNTNVKNYLGQFDGNLVPSADAVYDLGSNTNQWRSLWVSNNTIYLNRVPINITNGNVLLVNGQPLITANGSSNINTTGTITALTVGADMVDAANVIANYIAGDGSNIFNLNYSNANVANYLPTYTGNLSQSSDIIALYANAAAQSNAIANLQASQYGNANVANYLASNANIAITTQGNITLNGNINFTNLSANDWGRIFTSNSGDASYLALEIGDDAPGQADKIVLQSHYWVTNVRTAMLTAQMVTETSANITIVGNVVTSEQVIATGDVTGNYIRGNGAFLTGIAANSNYSNSNVASYLPTYEGNVGDGTGYMLGNGRFLTGIIATASYSNANVASYLPTYTGNISANYITANGDINADSVYANYFQGSGSGLVNLNLTGLQQPIDTTGNITANNFIGNIRGATGGYGNANVSVYLPVYGGNATFGNVSVNRDLVVLGNFRADGNTTFINANTLNIGDKNIVLANNATQLSDLDEGGLQLGNLASANIQFFYDYPTNVMTLTHGLTIANNVSVANSITATAGNLSLITNGRALTFSTTGNVTGANAITANYFYGDIGNATGGYGNTNVAAYLNSGSFIPFVTTGEISSGNIQAPYFFGNGAFLTGITAGTNYSNANVANYLPTYSGNVGNGAGYVFGNGAFLTGIAGGGAGAYSNANVANYLPTYTGNVGTGAGYIFGNGSALTSVAAAGSNTEIQFNNNGILGSDSRFMYQQDGFGVGALWVTGGIILTETVEACTAVNTTNINATGNILLNGYIGSLGNIYLGVSAGNVSDPDVYIYGNGRYLAGMYSNADVANYLPTYGGNIGTGNLSVGAGNAVAITSAGNIVAGPITIAGSTGNITAGNVVATGSNIGGIGIAANTITAGSNISIAGATGNIVAANLTVTRDLTVQGNLQVLGNTTTINANTLTINDKDIIVANGAVTPSQANGAGIIIGSNIASLLYNNISNAMVFSGNVQAPYFIGNGSQLTGIPYTSIVNSYGNANVAAYLPTYTGSLANSSSIIDLEANAATQATAITGLQNVVYSNANATAYFNSGQPIFIHVTGNIISGANIQSNGLNSNGGITTSGALNLSGRVTNTASNVTITSSSSSFNFSSDGTLYLPGDIAAGYRNVPQVSWTGSPTPVLSDAGKHYYTTAGGVTINLPLNSAVAFPIGTAITLVNQSASNCTIARGSVNLYLAGNATGTVNRTLTAYGVATLLKVAINDWFINGGNVV